MTESDRSLFARWSLRKVLGRLTALVVFCSIAINPIFVADSAPAASLPTARLVSTSSVIATVDATALSADWAKYYGAGLKFTHGFISAGTTFTMTWLATDANNRPLANSAVKLQANKAYSSSNAKFVAGCTPIANVNERNGADISGVTDSLGKVTFTITNLDSVGEPADTKTTEPDTNPKGVYGQFSLQIADLSDLQQAKEIVEIHVLGSNTNVSQPTCNSWVPPRDVYKKWVSVAPSSLKVAAPKIAGLSISRLLWSDEFASKKATAPNTKFWTGRYCGTDPANGGGSYCSGDQYNVPSANRHDGSGRMAITTNRVDLPKGLGDCGAASCQFSSGRFDSQAKLSVQYGYIEARIKLPAGIGQNPAFWMLGDSITKVGWPTSGEIDIMEQPLIGDYQNAGSLHYSTTLGGCCDNHITFTRYFDHTQNLANAFHTYAIAWLPGKVDFYFDGKLYGSLSQQNAATAYWPFDAPEFLIFDNTTPGNKSEMTWNKSTMLIDYVRVWQLNKLGKVWTH